MLPASVPCPAKSHVHVCCTAFISYAFANWQPEAGNVGESTTEQYTKSAKEAANFVTRGVGYLANAAKQAVVGDGLARESHNPAGEVTATRCVLGVLAWRRTPTVSLPRLQIRADQNCGVHAPAQCGKSSEPAFTSAFPSPMPCKRPFGLPHATLLRMCCPASLLSDRLSPNKQAPKVHRA